MGKVRLISLGCQPVSIRSIGNGLRATLDLSEARQYLTVDAARLGSATWQALAIFNGPGASSRPRDVRRLIPTQQRAEHHRRFGAVVPLPLCLSGPTHRKMSKGCSAGLATRSGLRLMMLGMQTSSSRRIRQNYSSFSGASISTISRFKVLAITSKNSTLV